MADWDVLAPVGMSSTVPTGLLDFDVNNPRFTPDKRPEQNTDQAVISKLASTADLAELVQSISTSGYIKIEPLIVVVRDGRLIVLEGNRRLAAIKCLLNPELAANAKLSLPVLTEEVRATLGEVLVYRVAEEEDARALIGFKHINGPQAWDAYAKALFAGRWLDSQRGIDGGLTLFDIANRMGDKHQTIHRMVTALYVLQQAQENEIYSIDDRQKRAFAFSHLYTGLMYSEFTSYLNMRRNVRGEDPPRNPVAPDDFPKLRQLLVWLYGSKLEDVQPVVKSQNPDLNRLKSVLASRVATLELERLGDLDAAVISATPKDARFSGHLLAANAELQKAMNTLDGFDPSTQAELQETADSAYRRSATIKAALDASIKGF
jgi:ParB-like nuclease domain